MRIIATLVVFGSLLGTSSWAGPTQEEIKAGKIILNAYSAYKRRKLERRFLETYRDLISGQHTSSESSLIASLPSTYDFQKKYGYFWPNEYIQKEVQPVLAKVPAGAYLSVGTDRGFMGAALSPEVTHLLLTDACADIVLFNQINTALIQIAKDREDYVQLRLSVGKQARSLWKTRARTFSQLDSESYSLLMDPENFHLWQKKVAGSTHANFLLFHARNPYEARDSEGALIANPDEPYAFANYLYEDKLFYKLQEMARNGRIRSLQVDYNHVGQVDRLMQSLQRSGIPLSVLDLSNAWDPAYIKRENLKKVLLSASTISQSKSLFLITESTQVKDRWGIGKDGLMFTFTAFQFDQISSDQNQAELWMYLESRMKQERIASSYRGSTQVNPHQAQ
jgi:hypothetical protein